MRQRRIERGLRAASALLLAAQLLPITYAGHRFWLLEPGPVRNTQRTQFFKNVSVAGAGLAIAGFSLSP